MSKKYLLALIALVVTVACTDPLAIANQNDPDRTRVFANPADLQVFVAGLFAVMHQSTLGGNNDDLETQMMVMGMENTSTLANFAMGPRGSIPRNPITNQRGSQGSAGNYHDWFRGHRAARQAALAIAALNQLSLGSGPANARARAFARFVQGIALGDLSLAYDSASILTENDNPQADAAVVVPLSGYQAVNTAALQYLDSAIAIATANPTAFPLPVVPNFWINGIGMTQAQFIRTNDGGLTTDTTTATEAGVLNRILYEKRYSLLWQSASRWIDARMFGKLNGFDPPAGVGQERGRNPIFGFPIPFNEAVARNNDLTRQACALP